MTRSDANLLPIRVSTVAVAVGALAGCWASPAALGLLGAVPPLTAAAWRSRAAFAAVSALAFVGLSVGCALAAAYPAPAAWGPAYGGGLLALAFGSWAGWRFLADDEERFHVRRKRTEDLEAELVRLRGERVSQSRILETAEKRHKRSSRLHEAAHQLSATLEPGAVAETTLNQMAEILDGLPVDLGVFVLDAQGRERLRRFRDLGGGAPFGDGPIGDDPLAAWVLEKASSLVIRDLEKDFRFRGLDMASFPGRSFHLLPLLNGQGQVHGLVRVASSRRECMDLEDQRLLESLVVLASLAFENVRLHEEAQDLADTDGLTRLLLRRALMERLEREFLSREQRTPLSLLMLDIDHFKAINDTYGHAVGDQVLREVAALVRRQVRDVDICGRYGGEEFLVLLPLTPLEGAVRVAERVREAVRNRAFDLKGGQRTVTVSLGVATAPEHGVRPLDLIAAADEALYRSKQDGRDRVTAAGAPA